MNIYDLFVNDIKKIYRIGKDVVILENQKGDYFVPVEEFHNMDGNLIKYIVVDANFTFQNKKEFEEFLDQYFDSDGRLL